MHTTSPPGWDAPALKRALQRLKNLGYTAQQIADFAQVSRPQVSRWSSGGHRPGYDALVRLAGSLLPHQTDPAHRQVVEDLFAAAGYQGPPEEGGTTRVSEMVSPYSGRVWRIVRTLEQRAEDAGLTEEEEQAMIERAMENAERQAEMAFDAELARRGREHDDQT